MIGKMSAMHATWLVCLTGNSADTGSARSSSHCRAQANRKGLPMNDGHADIADDVVGQITS